MPESFLTVAISSRALFDLDESNLVFEEHGLEAYRRYQIQREDEVLDPGDAYQFVKKLLNINSLTQYPRVEVILLSRNSADTGLRIFNSIRSHELEITRAAFSGGFSPYRYVRAFNCDLFLSTHSQDVRDAIDNDLAAATLIGGVSSSIHHEDLRIAFDGDAVLFSDEAERVYRNDGLGAFSESEVSAADEPLAGGPFKPFLKGLHRLQGEFDEATCPIRTALGTARAAPAHERVIKTLRAWDVRLDESLFLGGREKTDFLRAFGADVFFDDQIDNCDLASSAVPSGHVPHGITNETT